MNNGYQKLLEFVTSVGFSEQELVQVAQRVRPSHSSLNAIRYVREPTAEDLEGTGVPSPALFFKWGSKRVVWALHIANATSQRNPEGIRALALTCLDEAFRWTNATGAKSKTNSNVATTLSHAPMLHDHSKA